jgi:hypothetical protein
MKTTKHVIVVNNKKYPYTLGEAGCDATRIECEGANISQTFLNEDVPALLQDLPNLIVAEKKYTSSPKEVLRFRIATRDKKVIERKAVQKGYSSVSEYLRTVALSN